MFAGTAARMGFLGQQVRFRLAARHASLTARRASEDLSGAKPRGRTYEVWHILTV